MLRTLLLLLLPLAACAPRIQMPSAQTRPPLQPQEGFVVWSLQDTMTLPSDALFLGEIRAKDVGITVNCSYEVVLDSVCANAKRLGANLVRITRHAGPDLWSTCHRITANAYRLADITPYEREIKWHKNRRLRIVDFKADTTRRPFLAATASRYATQYYLNTKARKAYVSAYAWFNTTQSYFKRSTQDEITLAHEQGHFDLTEVYVRRLRKELQQKTFSMQSFDTEFFEMVAEMGAELIARQDEYDHDIYANNEKQSAWLARIAAELAALEAWENPDFTLRLQR